MKCYEDQMYLPGERIYSRSQQEYGNVVVADDDRELVWAEMDDSGEMPISYSDLIEVRDAWRWFRRDLAGD